MKLSIIIPVYNEAPNLEPLHRELSETLSAWGRSYELVLIDDGSHHFEHQLVTFRTLFKHIREDGLYVCEDLHTSYWEEDFNGGVRKPGTYIEFLKELIDELNAWFWRENVESEKDAFASAVHGMHFYPTLLVVEKRRVEKPLVTPVGHTPEVKRA